MKDAFGQHLMSFAKQNPKYVNAMAKATKGRRVEVAGAAIMGAAAITGAITLHNYYRNKNRQQKNSIQYIDHMRTGKMPINKSDTSVTKKVKSDYNKLSDQEFLNKYYNRKEKYLKNVNKYGDPYRANTLGRALNKKQKSSFKKRKKR